MANDRSRGLAGGDPFRLPRSRRPGNARRGGALERVAIGGKEGPKEDNSPGTSVGGRAGAQRLIPPDPDPLGKMALYSGEVRAPAYGTFLVECSSCKRETPVSVIQLARAALPLSLHLPLLRRYSSYMRCPACGRRAWLRVMWRM